MITLICCPSLVPALAQLRPAISETDSVEDVYIIEFTDNFGDGVSRPVTTLPAKTQRVSSDGGAITFNFDSAVPDSVRIAANVAANICHPARHSGCGGMYLNPMPLNM